MSNQRLVPLFETASLTGQETGSLFDLLFPHFQQGCQPTQTLKNPAEIFTDTLMYLKTIFIDSVTFVKNTKRLTLYGINKFELLSTISLSKNAENTGKE